MNKWFAAAALLSSVLAAAHIIGGTPEFLEPILLSDLAANIRAVAAIVWHAISVLLLVNSAVLIAAAMNRLSGRSGIFAVALQYLGFSGLFLYYGITRLGNVSDLLQWTVFAAISVMIYAGLRSSQRAAASSP